MFRACSTEFCYTIHPFCRDKGSTDPSRPLLLTGTANVSPGGALFAVATGAPIVVAIMRREHGLHVFDHLATLRPDPAATDRRAEAQRLTREVMKLLDDGIRRTPEQWFWYNKRWILQPAKKPKHRPRGR